MKIIYRVSIQNRVWPENGGLMIRSILIQLVGMNSGSWPAFIRRKTTVRKDYLEADSSEKLLDYGSDTDVTYHGVISTIKLHGHSVWNYIGLFFEKIFNNSRTMLIWPRTRLV